MDTVDVPLSGRYPRGLGRLINESESILPYLDIPFQHVSAKVLRAMGRPWKGDRVRKLVERLRQEIPSLVLRTTFMVGYPAEGDKEFLELRDFVESFDIEHVGVFTYSPEDGNARCGSGRPCSCRREGSPGRPDTRDSFPIYGHA